MGQERELRGQVWGGGSGVTQEGRGETQPARREQGFSHWVNTGLEKSSSLGSEKGVEGGGRDRDRLGPPQRRWGWALWFTRADPAPQMCPHPHLPPAACPLTLPRPSQVHSGPQSLSLVKHSFSPHGPIQAQSREVVCSGRLPLHLRTPEEES